jgi:hypothetical protein
MKKTISATFIFLLLTVVAYSQNNFVGRWVGTWGNGTQENPNYYSFHFNGDGTLQLYNQSNEVIANGTYQVTGNQITGSYNYTTGGTFSVSGSVDAAGILRGTWGSGNNVSGGGRWVMNSNRSNGGNAVTPRFDLGGTGRKTINKKGNIFISNTGSEYTDPVKQILLNDGKKIAVRMNRNPSINGDFVYSKQTKEQLPAEKKEGWTTEVRKVAINAESKSFMNASSNNFINILLEAPQMKSQRIGTQFVFIQIMR